MFQVSPPPRREPAPARSAVQRPLRQAVLVIHGMGQQARFATLDAVARGLLREDALARGDGEGAARPEAQIRMLEGQRVERLALTLRAAGAGEVEREVHVYEGYWAPLTEGTVTLRDVIRFLFSAGLRGLFRGSPFRRWMFDRYVHFDAPWPIPATLLVSLLALAALLVINGIVFLVTAAALPTQTPPAWLAPAYQDLTVTLNLWLGLALLFGTTLLVSRRAGGAIWSGISLGLLVVMVAATALAAAAMLAVIWSHGRGGGPLWMGVLGPNLLERSTWVALGPALLIGLVLLIPGYRQPGPAERAAEVSAAKPPTRGAVGGALIGAGALILAGLVLLGRWAASAGGADEQTGLRLGLAWFVLLAVSWAVRYFLVQYVGDVAAYVDSHRVDRFARVRKEVRDQVTGLARRIYGAWEPGGLVYDRIVVVGHSLGSVLAYDLLNLLINEDALQPEGGEVLDAAGRTAALVTFGSPLDKTAYLFSLRSRSEAREALASVTQPLLLDYALRPQSWINIHSPWDPISGALDFYDLPGERNPRRVRNLRDPDARTLFAAHTEYWENSLLYRELHRLLTLGEERIPVKT